MKSITPVKSKPKSKPSSMRSGRQPAGEFDQWVSECPKCHNLDCLTVYEFVGPNGKVHSIESRLHPDGFDTGLRNGGDTDNEKVRCDNCGGTFKLGDLTLPESQEVKP